MRISELSRVTGVSVTSIKYYLREGILPAGEALGSRQADYTEEHVRRLRLIRALVTVVGLPISQVKRVIGLIETPSDDMFPTLGEAVDALPPYPTEATTDARKHPRARALLEQLGWTFDADYAATAQLEQALTAIEGIGIPMSQERLAAYARAAREVAEFDISHMPSTHDSPGSAVEYAVLGTALYEPVLLALRRLAHRDAAARHLETDPQTEAS